MVNGSFSGDIAKVKSQLLEYCKLDTYAMVKILERLKKCELGMEHLCYIKISQSTTKKKTVYINPTPLLKSSHALKLFRFLYCACPNPKGWDAGTGNS